MIMSVYKTRSVVCFSKLFVIRQSKICKFMPNMYQNVERNGKGKGIGERKRGGEWRRGKGN